MLHGDSAYVCIYVFKYVSKTAGMQLLQNIFPVGVALLPCTCNRARVCATMESPADSYVAAIREAACAATRKSNSEERRERRGEVVDSR